MHKNAGNFANSKERARELGKKGGSISPGNFKNDRAKARTAGRSGGMNSGRRKQTAISP